MWPELRPFVDERASSAAKKLGLPSKAAELQELVGGDVTKLARWGSSLCLACKDACLAGNTCSLAPSAAKKLGLPSKAAELQELVGGDVTKLAR